MLVSLAQIWLHIIHMIRATQGAFPIQATSHNLIYLMYASKSYCHTFSRSLFAVATAPIIDTRWSSKANATDEIEAIFKSIRLVIIAVKMCSTLEIAGLDCLCYPGSTHGVLFHETRMKYVFRLQVNDRYIFLSIWWKGFLAFCTHTHHFA